MIPPVLLGLLAVNLHTFEGYSGVLTFALPYTAVYCLCLYTLAMDDSEKDLVRAIIRRVVRR